jgi:IS5 family transposase
MEEFSYEDLAFHLLDSVCYRSLCRIGFADKGFQESSLCNNIKAISSETWEAINRIFVAHGVDKKTRKVDNPVLTAHQSKCWIVMNRFMVISLLKLLWTEDLRHRKI